MYSSIKDQSKVHVFYVRFTCYIFEQTLLHYEFCVFSFTDVLAWVKGKRPSARNTWIIKEVDWDHIRQKNKILHVLDLDSDLLAASTSNVPSH